MKDRATTWITWTAAIFSMLFILFVLTAPPVMTSYVRAHGCCNFPALYQPFMSVLQSDYGGPMLWYFNDVWRAGIMLYGDASGPPLHIVLLYAIIGLALLAVVALPFWRRRRWRLAT